MNNKKDSRLKILLGAFKLFLAKEYAAVTTANIEEITRLTRGAIYYKVKNNKGLYRAVINKFVLEFLSDSLNRDIQVSEETPFLDFIMSEIDTIHDRMDAVRTSDVEANSTKYINLLSSVVFHYDGFEFEEECRDHSKDISDLWEKFLHQGIGAKEIKQGQKIPLLVPESGRFSYGTVLLSI